MTPWEAHEHLTAKSLVKLRKLAKRVWRRAWRSHKPDLGDTIWGLGTRFNERMRHEIKLEVADAPEPWLDVVAGGMHFIFRVGAVPMRFQRGSPNARRRKPMVASALEQKAVQTAFEFHKARFAFRLAVDATHATDKAAIYLVQFDTDSNAPINVWALDTLRAGRFNIEFESDTVAQVRGPVELEAPKLGRRKRSVARDGS